MFEAKQNLNFNEEEFVVGFVLVRRRRGGLRRGEVEMSLIGYAETIN